MLKLWRVAKHEYLKRVRQRSFLLAVLGIPLLIVAVSAISALVVITGGDTRPAGYVDKAEFLDSAVLPDLTEESPRFVEFRPYPSETAAREALDEGVIQAYYVIPEDYLTSKELTLYYGKEEPGEGVRDDFASYVRASLLSRQPARARAVLEEGLDLTVRSLDGRREISQGNVASFILPFISVFFLYFAVVSAGGYMLQAVTDEKENQTVEILTTSLSPDQLMAGKAVGLMGVSLTQLLIWGLTLGGALVIAAQFLGFLSGLMVPWGMLGLMALYFLPTFSLIAGMMTTIGAAVTELQQGQQISGIVNMLFILPVFFSALIFENPGSPLLVVLTFWPTTSFITVLLRWGMASVPIWQMILSWLLVTATAGVSMWLAARVFRMGMLRYGQRLSVSNIIESLRGQEATLEKEVAGHA
ncbi:MAG: ABC transporter permease [Anaerolineae bacterium]